ncbi:MAG: AEC family transporter [Desulfuromonadales bacterium]|nr:AEC family transporter [Desulfuromonadales bacterium]
MLFVQIILPVFLVVFSGFVLERTAKLDFRTLSVSSLYLFSPCLVFSALMKQEVSFSLAGQIGLFMLLYTAAMLILSLTAGYLLRFDRETRSALHLATVMMNIGNFGLPLTWFAFGQPGLEISILTFFFFNLVLSSLAIVLAQGSTATLRQAVTNAMKIPIFHAGILALALQAIGARVPELVLRPVDLLGQAAIPLMLVLLGMQLARTRLQSGAGFFSLAALLRLAVAPLLALALTWLLGIGGLAQKVIILQTSTPSAILPLLYALKFGSRPDLVAGAIFVTTLLSAISLTILLYFLQI